MSNKNKWTISFLLLGEAGMLDRRAFSFLSSWWERQGRSEQPPPLLLSLVLQRKRTPVPNWEEGKLFCPCLPLTTASTLPRVSVPVPPHKTGHRRGCTSTWNLTRTCHFS